MSRKTGRRQAQKSSGYQTVESPIVIDVETGERYEPNWRDEPDPYGDDDPDDPLGARFDDPNYPCLPWVKDMLGFDPDEEDDDQIAAPVVRIGDTDRNEVLAIIREVFSSGDSRDREQALVGVARALGYRRVGPRLREVLKSDFRTAVRRGILDNSRGTYSLLCRSIDEYKRDHMVEMLLAAIGAAWQTRDQAITASARHLGFRRTGNIIRSVFQSALNAALRRGLIEREGPDLIRKIR